MALPLLGPSRKSLRIRWNRAESLLNALAWSVVESTPMALNCPNLPPSIRIVSLRSGLVVVLVSISILWLTLAATSRALLGKRLFSTPFIIQCLSELNLYPS